MGESGWFARVRSRAGAAYPLGSSIKNAISSAPRTQLETAPNTALGSTADKIPSAANTRQKVKTLARTRHAACVAAKAKEAPAEVCAAAVTISGNSTVDTPFTSSANTSTANAIAAAL